MTYEARCHEGHAVIGHVTGHMTRTYKIGIIAFFPIPGVMQDITSVFLHAEKADPAVEMVVPWAYTWFGPAKVADAARAMIAQGVGVILQHTDSTAPQAAAAEAGNVYTFGQASDLAAFARSRHTAAIIDIWGPYNIERVQAVIDRTWAQQAHWAARRRARSPKPCPTWSGPRPNR